MYWWSAAAGLKIGGANAATAAGASCMLLQQAAHKFVQRLEVHIQLGVGYGIHAAARQAARIRVHRILHMALIESGYFGQAFSELEAERVGIY